MFVIFWQSLPFLLLLFSSRSFPFSFFSSLLCPPRQWQGFRGQVSCGLCSQERREVLDSWLEAVSWVRLTCMELCLGVPMSCWGSPVTLCVLRASQGCWATPLLKRYGRLCNQDSEQGLRSQCRLLLKPSLCAPHTPWARRSPSLAPSRNSAICPATLLSTAPSAAAWTWTSSGHCNCCTTAQGKLCRLCRFGS